jgi:hypothetical protein
MEKIKGYRFIEITIKHEFEKTNVYGIFVKNNYIFLGEVKWHAGAQSYVFFPDKEPNSIEYIKNQCLRDIYEFIQRLMIKHRGLQVKRQFNTFKDEN